MKIFIKNQLIMRSKDVPTLYFSDNFFLTNMCTYDKTPYVKIRAYDSNNIIRMIGYISSNLGGSCAHSSFANHSQYRVREWTYSALSHAKFHLHRYTQFSVPKTANMTLTASCTHPLRIPGLNLTCESEPIVYASVTNFTLIGALCRPWRAKNPNFDSNFKFK